MYNRVERIAASVNFASFCDESRIQHINNGERTSTHFLLRVCVKILVYEKAIIIGASSGIGKELAIVLSQNGYAVGLTGRRVELLNALQNELSTESFVKAMDISQADEAIRRLSELIEEMHGVELIVISAGIGFINNELEWKKEKATIETMFSGLQRWQMLPFIISSSSEPDILSVFRRLQRCAARVELRLTMRRRLLFQIILRACNKNAPNSSCRLP